MSASDPQRTFAAAGSPWLLIVPGIRIFVAGRCIRGQRWHGSIRSQGANMRALCTLVLAALLSAWSSIDHTVHVLGPGSWAQTPVVPEAMTRRVEDAAIEYEEHAPVPRVALFDVAFPASAEEFESTDGYGVLLLTALSQEKIELPPERIYVTLHGKEHVLKQISFTNATPKQSPRVERVLGANRWDALYLFPVHLMQDGAILTIDFAANRTGFAFGQFTAGDRDALGYEVVAPGGLRRPGAAQEAIMNMVAREYPGFLDRAP
ncbi:hypothetical protein AB4Y64_17625 [Lysobacter sp. TAF61]|uniref:hypothetical protein n=1 Tax=Lysobacter sp. TAF61 TaxID=3233072 RepID=UPI003F9E8E7F